MDKYVKRIKRKEDDCRNYTEVDKFYVPGGQWMPADAAAVACELGVQQPAAPQKSERPATPPSPISPVSPTSEDLSRKTIGRMKRIYVSRRLLFDDEEKVSVDKAVNQQLIINSQPTDLIKEKTTSEDDSYMAIIDSLSARGFVVNNHSLCDDGGGSLGQYDLHMSAGEDLETTDMTKEVGGVLKSLSPICGQFECLSLFEGIVYTVRVAAVGPAGDNLMETAKVLATVGPHPHIVSYFCNWADAHYHYIQTEQCQSSLSSLRMNNVADCRTVLEHISCALHHLHDGKMYSHNRVNRLNIYLALDGDRVVYKLGGFSEATKILVDSSAAAADVQSLCSMVSELIENGDGWSADEEDLQLYLSNMAGTVNPGAANALSVWRWCCGTRHRPPLLQLRQTSLSDMMYHNLGTSNKDGVGAADQTAVVSLFRKTDVRRASEITTPRM